MRKIQAEEEAIAALVRLPEETEPAPDLPSFSQAGRYAELAQDLSALLEEAQALVVWEAELSQRRAALARRVLDTQEAEHLVRDAVPTPEARVAEPYFYAFKHASRALYTALANAGPIEAWRMARSQAATGVLLQLTE